MHSVQTEFGEITAIDVSGNPLFDPFNKENALALRKLKEAGRDGRFIHINHELSGREYNVELQVEGKRLNILFRNAAAELLTSIPVMDKRFYESAAKYRELIREQSHAGMNVEHYATIKDNRNVEAVYGTVLLVETLRNATPGVDFSDPLQSRNGRAQALFHLCAFALGD